MKNVEQMSGEVARRLREIKEQLCCLTEAVQVGGGTAYNQWDHIQIDDGGGPTTYTVPASTVHAVAWQPITGSVNVDRGGGDVEYVIGGSIEFSTVNTQAIVFTIVSGETLITWQY